MCHQLSNGADATIVAAPQTARNAPSGPRNPHTLIDAARSGAPGLNVVVRISAVPAPPAMMPPAWIRRCAGVQNVSRPIDMCHEMSQYTPARMQVTDASDVHTNQGGRDADVIGCPIPSNARYRCQTGARIHRSTLATSGAS